MLPYLHSTFEHETEFFYSELSSEQIFFDLTGVLADVLFENKDTS